MCLGLVIHTKNGIFFTKQPEIVSPHKLSIKHVMVLAKHIP